MKGYVVAEVSVVPLGTASTSLSQYVASCVSLLEDDKTLAYQLTPMGTIIEGPLDKVLEMVRKMHELPFEQGALRVSTTVKIDDRRDKKVTMAGKIESVLKKNPNIKVAKQK